MLLYFQAVTEDEKVDEEPEKCRKFQLSSLNPQERFDYCHLIEELGTGYLQNAWDSVCCKLVSWSSLGKERASVNDSSEQRSQIYGFLCL